jgi:hypothetical protein
MAANPFKLTVAQMRDKRRSVRHNVGGVRGLAVRVEGAKETINALAQLPAGVQRRVLRQALAAAARPVMAAAKAGAKAYENQSSEAVGTVGRSFAVKVATSKRDPSIAYALVGAKRGYAEIVRINQQGAVQSLRVRRRGKKLRKGVYAVKGRNLKNLGPTARKARLDPKNGLTQRRTATRYLHLIELGPRGRIQRKGGFMDNAAKSSARASVTDFNRILFAGINREFAKRAAK